MLKRPCEGCKWSKPSGSKLVCLLPRCVVVDGQIDDAIADAMFDRLMRSANTYERRDGKVRQTRYADP